jgi:SAM-dependent methyltransferase
MAVHRHAESFGSVAEAYERGRPAFPTVVVDHLIGALHLQPGRRVADVAAGTGKLTRDLLRSGAEVVAVEPAAGMRRVFAEQVPSVTILDGTAELLPLDDASVDAITVAQAFHWFDARQAFAEMDRVLRAGGRVALVWNVRDPADLLETQCTEIVDRHRDTAPGRRSLDLEGALAASPFRTVDRQVLDWSVDVDEPTFLDRFLSISFVASLDDRTRRAVEHDLRVVFGDHAVDGYVSMAYSCQTHVLERSES